MKRFLIAILALAVLLLPGCHNEMDALMGTWQVKLDAKDMLMQRLEQECPGIGDSVHIGSLPVTLELTFYADSTYQAQVDGESVKTACEGVIPALEQGIWEYWRGLYEAQNPGGDLEGYLQSLGVSRRELIAEVIGDTLAEELILQMDIREEGRFSAEGGKLRFFASPGAEPDEESYHTYRVSGKTLTLQPGKYAKESDRARYEKALPLVFEKG